MTKTGIMPVGNQSKPRSRKAQHFFSKLANPTGSIYKLAKVFKKYLHMNDPSALYALMGAVAGNMIEGHESVWLMVIGGSSGGKTTMLRSLRNLEDLRLVGDIDNKSAFLSGTKAKDMVEGAKGGLLGEFDGRKGACVFYEFSSILELPKDQLKSILTVFRQIYDRRYTRDIGGEGGRQLAWTGKLAMFAGVTDAIDHAYEFASVMGERWLMFRMPETDGYDATVKVLSADNNYNPEWEDELAAAVKEMFDELGMVLWETIDAERGLTNGEIMRIANLSQFATSARSPTRRDHRHEIYAPPSREQPMRFARALTRMYVGLELIGLDNEDCWNMLYKVAIDSMPLLRGIIVKGVIDKPGITSSELMGMSKVSEGTLKRAIEDLERYQLVQRRTKRPTTGESGDAELDSNAENTGPRTRRPKGLDMMKGYELHPWAQDKLTRAGMKLGAGIKVKGLDNDSSEEE